ncbi:histidinol-phosphate transaminase, partial [Salmonella enterica subsp. enterica serovar Typhimurium]|uniref:aminotransferase class I/II-fold pyridoxal phosphate-dependent enzyme n=1 Tax=Salmonella enterica TaxID=28901 RepID=UPI000CB0FEDB
FSKIYGLAGIRVGFGAAPDKLIQSILKVKEPFNVNSLAQAAATAAIGDDAHVKASKDLNAAGARKLYQAFRDLGMDYVETEANFILARLGDNG